MQTPSFRGEDFASEKFEAEYRARTSPVSAEHAKAALASLPGDTQRGVAELVSEHGAGAREHLAYQAMGEWSPAEREALRTLAAAEPQIRKRAVDEMGEGGSGSGAHRESPAPSSAGVETPPGPGVGDAGATGSGSLADAGEIGEVPPLRETYADTGPSAATQTPAGGQPPPPAPPAPGPAPAPSQPGLPSPPGRRGLPPPREPRSPSPEDLFRE